MCSRPRGVDSGSQAHAACCVRSAASSRSAYLSGRGQVWTARRAAFAERIRALRAAAGLTQMELARRADIGRTYYAEVDLLGEGRQGGSRRRLSTS